MEAMVKKYQQKFKKVRAEIKHWEELRPQLLSQFRNASSIIERLQMMADINNYGNLKCVDGIKEALLRKQMGSLETILLSIKKTMEEFHGIVLSLEKIYRDGRQLVGGGSTRPTVEQLEQRIGVKPPLADCMNSLRLLHEMHHSQYLLDLSIVSAFPRLILKPSASDLSAMQQLLVDQPNIPKDEVEFIFDIIFAEEIC